jgi:hypothetical protein
MDEEGEARTLAGHGPLQHLQVAVGIAEGRDGTASDTAPAAATPARSPFSSDANGSLVFHSGCCGASCFTCWKANRSWKGTGFSAQSVPSLSNVAIRSGTGTKSGEPSLVTFSTNELGLPLRAAYPCVKY